MSDAAKVLSDLMAVIQDRKANPPARSYTTSLFAAGVERIGDKILEEAQEVVDAARESDLAKTQVGREHLVHEVADLIYHLFVMMGHQDVSLEDVSSKLAERFGTSGLDEKAARRAATN